MNCAIIDKTTFDNAEKLLDRMLSAKEVRRQELFGEIERYEKLIPPEKREMLSRKALLYCIAFTKWRETTREMNKAGDGSASTFTTRLMSLQASMDAAWAEFSGTLFKAMKKRNVNQGRLSEPT